MKKSLVARLFFIVLFTSTFLCCKKGSTPTPATALKSIAGLWSLHGTYYGPGSNGNYFQDTVVTTMTIFQADDSTFVSEMDSDYTVFLLSSQNDSTITLTDFGGGVTTIIYNFNNNSLTYYYVENGVGLNASEFLFSSPPHTPQKNSAITSNIAKMAGTKQWHGTTQTDYIPPGYPGVPTFDTTFYDTVTMQIIALEDTLILDRIFYEGYYAGTVWEYIIYRKTFNDQSTTVFTSLGDPDDLQTITYYSVNNSMFFLDSEFYGGPYIEKWYTP